MGCFELDQLQEFSIEDGDAEKWGRGDISVYSTCQCIGFCKYYGASVASMG